MIRCAWVLTDLVGGGAERIPLLLAPALQSELTLMLLKDRIQHELTADAPEVISLSDGRRSLAIAGIPILARSVRAARDYDILVAGLEWAPTFFARACGAIARRPVVATVHVDLHRYVEFEGVPRSWWAAMRLSLKACVAVVAVSDDVKRSVETLGVDERRIHVIPNPVALPPIRDNGSRISIVSVASLHTRKGLDVAIDAASRLIDLDFEWMIVGDGPERKHLEHHARDRGVADRVLFAGFHQNPQPFYDDATVFVLPSRLEGNPLALVEAMAAGLPAVATRCATAVEEHLAGGAGLLVPVDDPDALATAIRSLLNDPVRREQMGRVARAHAAAYTPAKIAERYDALFSEVLSRE